MQADPLLGRGLATRYGRADREISKLIGAMAEVRASVGKKTMFGGDRHAAAVRNFIEQLFKACATLIETRALSPGRTKTQDLSALNSILANYRLVYAKETAAFQTWDDFFKHQLTFDADKPWLKVVL